MKLLYGQTFDDPIPTYCELDFPNCAFTWSVNEITEVKFKIVWEDVSDDQLETYGNILDNFSIELWVDFFRAIQSVVITPYITS